MERELKMSATSFSNARTITNSGNLVLEQSVQDILLTGSNYVAVNLTVSLLLAPWTNNSLSRRQCTDILEATFVYIQQAGRRL